MIVKRLSGKLKEIKEVEFAYLFGSYADNDVYNNSDVDVAVYLVEDDFDVQLQIILDLSKVINKDVDLVVLNRTKNLYLIDEIIQKGIVIKDSSARVDFELKKHHQFLDFKEFQEMIHNAA